MTDKNQIIKEIRAGETSLGIEFGSTRIKAVLVGKEHAPIASGSYEWENQLVDSIWTYSLEDIWKGLQTSYQELAKDVKEQYGEILTKICHLTKRTIFWYRSVPGEIISPSRRPMC